MDETTGRLPDQYIPQKIIDLQGDLEQAVTGASSNATAASQSASQASASASAAKTSETNAASSATAAQNAVNGFGLEVGTTTTGEPRSDASVEIQKTSTKYTANFTIPRGDKGDKGDKGDTGATGAPGPKGADGDGGHDSDDPEWPEYKQPTGAHDAYHVGDKITYNGKHYTCVMEVVCGLLTPIRRDGVRKREPPLFKVVDL